ncbi:MAG: phosphoribosylamine--glycine ligase, partial [Clostridiales bacterium]|nr:phosphoribosylamine--glycine ligase [Clostridiales bacterium]
VRFAAKIAVDPVFVGPDDPLALGMVDALEDAGIRAFGPRKAAARLESSKAFAKAFMQRHGIPTAAYRAFTDEGEAIAYIEGQGAYPCVVKADGLALGKGVIIAADAGEACAAVRSIMSGGAFGSAGDTVVVEEFLTGREVTVLAFTDGHCLRALPSSQAHKRALDGDRGPNTGGMGAFAPSPAYTPEVARSCEERIFGPTLAALKEEGIAFKGILYFGLMLTGGGPKLVEYNARFGDPEAQAVLPLLKTDLLDIVEAVIDERLDCLDIKWENKYSACIVAASGGYPGQYAKGREISLPGFPAAGPGALGAIGEAGSRAGANSGSGVDAAAADGGAGGCVVFHAGTAVKDGRLLTSGGRVLGVSALGGTLGEAVANAYAGIGKVSFEGMFYRSDIGKR